LLNSQFLTRPSSVTTAVQPLKGKHMTISKRKVLAAMAAAAATPAFAQFGGLGGLGGNKGAGGGGDPGKIEADVRGIIEKTSQAISKLWEALGDKEKAAAAQKLGDDIKNGRLGVSDSAGSMGDMCSGLKAEMDKAVSEGKKAEAQSARVAAQAIGPGIETLPLWKGVIDGIKSLDKSKTMSGSGLGLVQAVGKLPSAAKNSGEMFKAGVSYLSFSGVDMKETEKALSNNLTKMT